jgi:hypothetical protein
MKVNIRLTSRVAFRLYYQAEYCCSNIHEVITNARQMWLALELGELLLLLSMNFNYEL